MLGRKFQGARLASLVAASALMIAFGYTATPAHAERHASSVSASGGGSGGDSASDAGQDGTGRSDSNSSSDGTADSNSDRSTNASHDNSTSGSSDINNTASNTATGGAATLTSEAHANSYGFALGLSAAAYDNNNNFQAVGSSALGGAAFTTSVDGEEATIDDGATPADPTDDTVVSGGGAGNSTGIASGQGIASDDGVADAHAESHTSTTHSSNLVAGASAGQSEPDNIIGDLLGGGGAIGIGAANAGTGGFNILGSLGSLQLSSNP